MTDKDCSYKSPVFLFPKKLNKLIDLVNLKKRNKIDLKFFI